MVDEIIQNKEASEEIPVEIPINTPTVESSVEPIVKTEVETPIQNQEILSVPESVENSEEVVLDQVPVISEPIPLSGNQNIEVKTETNVSPEIVLEKEIEESVVTEGVSTIVETPSVSATSDVLPDPSSVVIENPKIESVEILNQDIKPINSIEQVQENHFLCNPLSDSFLRNMKNFKEIGKIGRETILLRKQKRLDKIMTLFLNKNHITLSEVERFLRVTEKTASRYITELKKQNKIKKSGKDDRGAFLYVKL